MEGTLHSKRYRTANKDEALPVSSPGGLVQSGGYAQVAMGTNPKTAEENAKELKEKEDKKRGEENKKPKDVSGEPIFGPNKGKKMDEYLDELNPNRKKKDGK